MIKTPLSTVIGGAFWTPGATIIGSSSKNLTQLIKSLFSLGEQGFAYDPNDLTTLYQDAAGTIPVTAAGQPVGLVLDKSKGLVVGTNAVLNGDFSQGGTGWGFTGGVTFSGGKAVYDGLNNPAIYQYVPNIELGAFYKVRFTISNLVKDALAVRIGTGAFNFGFNQNKTYEVILPAIGSGLLQFPTAGSGAVLELSDISVKKLSGNHAYQTVSASRPILQRNATTGAYYLVFDGVDDFLQTSNINLSTSDQLTLFAGVKYASDTLVKTQMIAEFSEASIENVGSFALWRGYSNKPDYAFRLSDTTYRDLVVTIPTNINVLTAYADASEKIQVLKANGVIKVSGGADVMPQNFGNYPLFIGGNTAKTFSLAGHIYGLIGIGRLTTDSETIALEKAIAKNTGVTLNV